MKDYTICDICYEENEKSVKCFGTCSSKVCLKCLNKMIDIKSTIIYFNCPICRYESIYNKNKRFTRFCKSRLSTMNKINKLLLDKVSNLTQQNLDLDYYIEEYIDLYVDTDNLPRYTEDTDNLPLDFTSL
jgi:hypothetical protein